MYLNDPKLSCTTSIKLPVDGVNCSQSNELFWCLVRCVELHSALASLLIHCTFQVGDL